MWASLLSILASGLKLLGWGASEIHDSEERTAGKNQQAVADQATTIKEGENANAVETDVAKLSDSAVDDGLREFSRPDSK